MPPRTRAAGPPEGGFTQLQAATREKKPKSKSHERRPKAMLNPRKHKKMVKSPVAAPALTEGKAAQTPQKRALEDADAEVPERALKRPNTEPRPQHKPTFLFGDRNRSALTPGRHSASISKNRRLALSQSARRPYHSTNPFDAEANEVQAALPKPQETSQPTDTAATETPTRQTGIVGRVFGSIRRSLFGGRGEDDASGSQSPTPEANPIETNPFEAAPIAPRRAAQSSRLARLVNSPRRSTTSPASTQQASVEDAPESPVQKEHDLQTVEVPGSRKRKLDIATEERQPKKPMLNADENGNITGSFGISLEDLEYSDDEEGDVIAESTEQASATQERPTTQNTPAQQQIAHVSEPTEPEQPEAIEATGSLGLDNFEPPFTTRGKKLRSAIKSKPNVTGKKVGFSSNLTSEHFYYRDLGPAGEYKGTLFAPGGPQTPNDNTNNFTDASPMNLDTPSTTASEKIERRGTDLNTLHNAAANVSNAMGGKKPWWDQTHETPSNQKITNTSGHFEVPYVDDSPAQDEPTTVPSAPKIPHASLPDTDERLNKARQEAQQYKPKQSSRLSNVQPARSRSTSPNPTAATNILTDEAEKMREAEEWARNLDWPTPQPYADPEAEEKMREAEEWAATINWPKPQTYVEAGLCSPFIDQLLRDKWSKEDDRLTHDFWTKEFREVSNMMDAAKAAGTKLELVYDEDD